MYPHERSLVKRLADRPFALIGINSDQDREETKKKNQEQQITWRSFWNGGGKRGPISTTWHVQGLPVGPLALSARRPRQLRPIPGMLQHDHLASNRRAPCLNQRKHVP